MDTPALRARAEQEVQELGPPPDDPTDRSAWVEERRGAVELLAALANYDQALVLRSTVVDAEEHLSSAARDLLVEAASIAP
jgi:hypothetical protein